MAGTHIVGEISNNKKLAGKVLHVENNCNTVGKINMKISHRQCRLAVIQSIHYIIRIKSGHIKCVQ